jgi:amino acid transporter
LQPDAAEPAGRERLVRALGRWTLTALVVNAIIGSGIFGLPDDVARQLGRHAPLAWVFAALGIGVVMACFAEVASRFRETGGPYLFARAAFGRFAGLQMGWFAWLTRITAAAANANLFVESLAWFWPAALLPLPRAGLLVTLIGLLALVNVRGVRSGAGLSNVFTVAKLLPIVVFVAAAAFLAGGAPAAQPGPAVTPAAAVWLTAILPLMFALGGFEAALIPLGEAKDPRRDAPFALFTALAVVAVVYVAVQLAVMRAFPDPASFTHEAVQQRPVAEAARVFLGGFGASLIAAGVMLSTYGYLAGQFVSAPRLTYAFAEGGDFPRAFAAVHPRHRTPYASILVHALLVCAFAIPGGFLWNAVLSAVARLVTYGMVCASVPRLRQLDAAPPGFRLPGGWLLPMAGLAFCAVLVAQMNLQHAGIAAGIAAAAALNWALVRGRRPRPGS